MKPKIVCNCSAILFLCLQALSAHAIDLQPGEIRAPKPGINLLLVSYQRSERGDYYVRGDRQPADTEINASQLQVRLGHSFEIADHPAFFYVQTPMGYVHPGKALAPLDGDSGIGDTSLLLAFWPYANHETQTYFALGAYLTVPTGSYDHMRTFNMGQNRTIPALQAGFQSPVVGALSWMTAFDAVWFGQNNDFGRTRAKLEQDVLYTAQVGLRYDFDPRFSLGATYFHTFGGETQVNDIDRNDRTKISRYQLSAITNFSFGRITLQYGSDFSTENGFIEDRRWLLRYSVLF